MPIPWEGDSSPYGFGDGEPWLPMPGSWADLTVEAQQADEGSTLAFFRRALRLRRELLPSLPDEVEVVATAPGTFAFRRGGLVCMVNCGSRAARLPDVAGDVLLASGVGVADGRIHPDTAAWLRTAP